MRYFDEEKNNAEDNNDDYFLREGKENKLWLSMYTIEYITLTV